MLCSQKACHVVISVNALNAPGGKDTLICGLISLPTLPREEICAFRVDVVSAFDVWKPAFYGDEIVPAAAQPPPQS